MALERPADFADRLPRVVPKEESDISSLSDEMSDLLYPGRRPRPFRLGVRFLPFDEPNYSKALSIARQSPAYGERQTPDGLVHEAHFEAGAARTLRDLFELVRGRPGSDVLVDGRKVPYAHELWLPLFWIFIGAEV
jgi:hypothetical protein